MDLCDKHRDDAGNGIFFFQAIAVKKNRNKKWISVPKDYSEKKSYRPVIREYNCVWKYYDYWYEGRRIKGRWKSCKKEYGPRKYYTKHYKWYGCVGSREYPNNLNDGQNTKSKNPASGKLRYRQKDQAYHRYRNLDEANKWTKEACARVKLDKIEVYTVTFGNDLDDATKLLMKGCASDPDKYFDASSGDALDATFQHIANSIRKVYLTQ